MDAFKPMAMTHTKPMMSSVPRLRAFAIDSDYNFRSLLRFSTCAGRLREFFIECFCCADNMAFAAARCNSALETSNRYRPVGFFLYAWMYAAPSRVLMSWLPFFHAAGIRL